MIKSLSVAEAKRSTQEVENQIVELVPAKYVMKTTQLSKGVLMKCTTQGAVNWAGGTTITLSPSADIESLLEDIRAGFRTQHGYATSLTKDKSGDPKLEIKSRQDALWIVGPLDKTTLDISSWSPCFPVPEGMSPSDKY